MSLPVNDIFGSAAEKLRMQSEANWNGTSDQVRSHVFETFGEESKATHWLNRPNQLWGGKTPAEILETEPEEVERELIRIDHGISG